MDPFQAVILSIIEGITEFLPISSTGHLVLTSKFLGISQTNFVKSFEIIIQLGAILAVVILYWEKVFNNISLGLKIIVAFLPSALLGVLFYGLIKEVLIGNTAVTLTALFAGGIALILFEKYYREKEKHISDVEKLTLTQSVIIGLCQSVAMIPGVSRAAATVVGGLTVGLKRQAAVEFSFLLAIPTMVAATALDLFKSSFKFTQQEYVLLAIGFAGSFLTAWLAVKFFVSYIKKHTFIPFAVYRIVVAVLFWLFVMR